MLDHMKRVEENPHRVRRIRHAPVPERVRSQQIAELVVNFRLRHGHPGQQREAREDRDAADRGDGTFFISREPDEGPLDPRKNSLA